MTYQRTVSLTAKAYSVLHDHVVLVPLLDLPWYDDTPSGVAPAPAPRGEDVAPSASSPHPSGGHA